MAVATYSKHKKQNLKIGIYVMIGLALYFAYDGYISKSFAEKHTKDGKPDSVMVFNKKAPPYFLVGAALCGIRLAMVRKRKLESDEKGIEFSGGKRIDFDAVTQVNKTYYDSKGYFDIVYTESGSEKTQRFSKYAYDGMDEILNELISKIS